MLISTDYTGQNGSVWKCDRCGDILPNPRSNRFKFDLNTRVKSKYKLIKSFDLCKHCTALICKAIDKNGGKDNKEEKKGNDQ